MVNVWGVGTKFVTAYDQPALGGVYKLSAVRGDDGRWLYKVKLSEQVAKVSTPGIQQVRRFRSDKEFIGDGIFDVERGAPAAFTIVDPLDATRRKHIAPETPFEDLLVPIFRRGKPVYWRLAACHLAFFFLPSLCASWRSARCYCWRQ
jgi:nicotinate phosphoribosyltransferase